MHLTIAIERPTISSLIEKSQHDYPVPGEGYGRAYHARLLRTVLFLSGEINPELNEVIGDSVSLAMVVQTLRALTEPLAGESYFEAVEGFVLSNSDDVSIIVAAGSAQMRVPIRNAEPLRALAVGNRVHASSVSSADSVYLDQLIRLGLISVVTFT